MYIVLDTETNDLGKDARIVSICWNLYSKKGKIIEEHYYLIKPAKGMIMNPSAEKVHGISITMLKKEGIQMGEALDKLNFCIVNNNSNSPWGPASIYQGGTPVGSRDDLIFFETR